MSWLFDQPPVIIVFVTVAVLMAFIEIALPTLGVAGTLGGACVVAAIAAIAKQDANAWPLAGCAVAFAIWALLIAGGRRHTAAEIGTVTLYGISGLGFAYLNEDVASAVVSVAAAALMAAVFPQALAAARKIMTAPPQTGMESLHGRAAVVDRWSGSAGTVTLDGSRWNAYLTPVDGAVPTITPGHDVRVVGHRGIALEVAPGPDFVPTAPGRRTMPTPPVPPGS